MTSYIDPARLRLLRRLKGLSQQQLANKAQPRVTKQTIHRIESGRQPKNRPSTIQSLSKALEFRPEVLAGIDPIPTNEMRLPEYSQEDKRKLTVKLDEQVRNAYSLAALRYGVSVSRIVEIAPLLFVMVAEQSLERRRAKLREVERVLDEGEKLRNEFPYLPASLLDATNAEDAVLAEQQSIASRDILAARLPDEIFGICDTIKNSFDPSADNPFVLYLREALAALADSVSFRDFDKYSTSYQVCLDDALNLAGGDERIAEGILHGWVLLSDMPRELLKSEKLTDRVLWLRSKLSSLWKRQDEFSAMSPEEQAASLLEGMDEALASSSDDGDGL